MQVVIRCDASNIIGSGHVMRCLTLADGLRAEGADVLFVCRAHEVNLCDLIEGRGYEVTSLPLGIVSADPALQYAAWLGAPAAQDAAETRAAMLSAGYMNPDWLIIDHYAIGELWEQTLRASAGRIMVIDDLADRRHDCDALLDQNLVADYESRYDSLVSPHATKLLGPSYALLQPQYAELRKIARPRIGPVRRILVYFGAADHGLTGLAVTAFLSLAHADIALDVVVGAASQGNSEIEILARQHPNVAIHQPQSSLAELMLGADLAIGGCGVTAWERLCLMLPTVVVTLADNQVPVAKELSRLNMITLLGRREDATSESIGAALLPVLSQGAEMTLNGVVIDGAGVSRTCKAILEFSK